MSGTARRFGLSNNQIKIIAMVSMLVDHMGLILFPSLPALRAIGRLAFPLFAYMIAEGAAHTRHRARYFLTVTCPGVAFQAVYWVVDRSWHLNVLLTFAMSLALIFSIDAFAKRRTATTTIGLIVGIGGVAFLSVVAPWLFESVGFHVDYGLPGVLFPVAVFFTPAQWYLRPTDTSPKGEFWAGHPLHGKLTVAAAMLVIMGVRSGSLQWYGLLALPLLMLYNGERGKWRMKYMFYVFYPLHLAVLYGIAWFWSHW